MVGYDQGFSRWHVIKNSKKFHIRLIVGIPLIFFGITIFTALLTYYLTINYINSSIALSNKLQLDCHNLSRLQFWVLGTAIFSFLSGFILIHSITNPMNKLLKRAKDLTNSHMKNRFLPLFEKNDEIKHFYIIFDEILTLLKSNLREQDMIRAKPLLNKIKRTDQLAALGLFSAHMAHEIRNPLGSIMGLVQLMEKDFKKGDPKKDYVDLILKAIERLNKSVEELLEFSKPYSDKRELIDINKLVKESFLLAKHEFKDKEIKVLEKYYKNLPFIKSDSQKLNQAFLNIIRNSFQFTNKGGNIHIKTQYEETGFISVQFFNTGSYICPEDLEMIFIPFFTTQKQGTGLGLCIANYIISIHGGVIKVKSDQNSGTTFMVELPIEKVDL